MIDSSAISELRHKAHTLSTSVEVSGFLAECNKAYRQKTLDVEKHAELQFIAFATLHRLCGDTFADARPIFLKKMLPWCMKSFKGTSKADLYAYRCRELFGQWYNELSSADHQTVREPVINYLTDHLVGRTFKAACWTLGDIGYRDQGLVDLLKRCALNNPSKDGDYALGLLFDLGLNPAEKEQFVDEALRRVQKRQYNSIYYSLVMSASLRILNFIRDRLDSPVSKKTNKHSDLLGVLAGVCERIPEDAGAADLAILLVRRMYNLNQKDIGARLAFASNLLPAINSGFVGEVFADLFMGLGPAAEQNVHAVYVQLLRMRECLGPRQLAGLPSCASKRFIEILKAVVFTDAENNSPNGSLLFDAKSESLWAALALESCDSLNWLSEALAHERNPYHQQDLMQTYACFRIQAIPAQIRSWITDRFDAQRENNAETWITRTAALRVARSAATQEAFDILLESGFTLSGNVLLDTVNALADVALTLTKDSSKCGCISHALLESIDSSDAGPKHSAAIHAILTLARSGRLPTECHVVLSELAFRKGQIDYDQARLLEALYRTKLALDETVLSKLAEWAGLCQDRVGEMSLEWLIRSGRLELKADILNRLGLKRIDGVLHWDHLIENTTTWAPFFVGLMFEQNSAEFEFAVLDILKNADWQQCAQIYDVLQRMAKRPEAMLTLKIRKAAVSRLIERITPNQAELSLFALVPRVAPEEFLDHEWEMPLEQWFADARIAFAEGVRFCLQQEVSMRSRNKGMQLLIRLSQDSQYGVRRASFRALAKQDASILCMLIGTWSRSERHEVRIWAAEAVAWVEGIDNNMTEWTDVLARMQYDTHKKVRSAYADAVKNRRKRYWAADYLGRLNQLISPSNTEMLAAWRYGWALSSLSDDDNIQELKEIQADTERASNVRHFVGLIIKAAEKQWEERKKKWPDPIYPLRGASIETGTGVIVIGEQQLPVDFVLWGEPATGPNSYGHWGASCHLRSRQFSSSMLGKPAQFRTDDERSGEGFIQAWSPFEDLVFCGNGYYPAQDTPSHTKLGL
jgi:hypothetical protein